MAAASGNSVSLAAWQRALSRERTFALIIRPAALWTQPAEQFLSVLTSGLSVATSSGSTGEAVRADLSNLLAAITTGQASRLFLISDNMQALGNAHRSKRC
jgi:hypothetical protein